MRYFPNSQPKEHKVLFQQPVEDDLSAALEDIPPEETAPVSDEELAEQRRDRLRLLAAAGDMAGVLLAVTVILALLALLFSLGNWVWADITRSFTLLRSW